MKAGEKPEQNPNPWAPSKGTYIEELFLKNTDPDKVMFELDAVSYTHLDVYKRQESPRSGRQSQ